MATLLERLLVLMGLACVLIGLYHLVGGISTVPGDSDATGILRATVDSRERFYNPIFVGYGLAWLWAARQTPIPATFVRGLAGVMFLGGLGRIISLLVYGWPHWFQVPLAVIEILLPPLYFWLAPADERRAAAAHSASIYSR